MGNFNSSLDDIKKNIQDWTDSEIIDDQGQEEYTGGKGNSKPSWGSFCGGTTPQ